MFSLKVIRSTFNVQHLTFNIQHSTFNVQHSTLRRSCFLILFLVMLVSCGNTENTYTTGTTFFVFDNSTHQDATLASAMNSTSPGVFCIITKGAGAGGSTVFSFKNNQGLSSSKTANAVDLRRTSILGYNNAIIVGFGNLDMPAVFYAYDRECPNCFDPDMLPMKSKPLSISNDGIATCSVCHRKYNLNTGGNIISGDAGKSLTRYRAATTGGYGVLTVN